MRNVSKQEFYAAMGPLDVHPSPQGNWDNGKGGYRTEWKLSNGRIVGESQGDRYSLMDGAK